MVLGRRRMCEWSIPRPCGYACTSVDEKQIPRAVANSAMTSVDMRWEKDLPRECIECVALHMDPTSAVRLMASCSDWRRDLNNDPFWRRLHSRDYGESWGQHPTRYTNALFTVTAHLR